MYFPSRIGIQQQVLERPGRVVYLLRRYTRHDRRVVEEYPDEAFSIPALVRIHKEYRSIPLIQGPLKKDITRFRYEMVAAYKLKVSDHAILGEQIHGGTETDHILRTD
jgi:hypothetical protein